jgi:hypothetical protein
MARKRVAPGHGPVKEMLDLLRPNFDEIGMWFPREVGGPISREVLSNYHNGRRKMPPRVRRQLAKLVKGYVRRLLRAAKRLDRSASEVGPGIRWS